MSRWKLAKSWYVEEMQCPDCNCIMYVPRKKARKREEEHIKDLYCVKCKEVKKFMIKSEIEKLKRNAMNDIINNNIINNNTNNNK